LIEIAAVDLNQMQHSARRASKLLKSLSNESRLLIMCNLAAGEKSVTELQELVGLRQSALSQHLARLRRDNLVQTRRQSQTIYYSLRGEEASRVIEVLYQMYCASGLPRDSENESAGAEAQRAPLLVE
jgi:DNA-binding transcriptional ArsR family regulator